MPLQLPPSCHTSSSSSHYWLLLNLQFFLFVDLSNIVHKVYIYSAHIVEIWCIYWTYSVHILCKYCANYSVHSAYGAYIVYILCTYWKFSHSKMFIFFPSFLGFHPVATWFPKKYSAHYPILYVARVLADI